MAVPDRCTSTTFITRNTYSHGSLSSGNTRTSDSKTSRPHCGRRTSISRCNCASSPPRKYEGHQDRSKPARQDRKRRSIGGCRSDDNPSVHRGSDFRCTSSDGQRSVPGSIECCIDLVPTCSSLNRSWQAWQGTAGPGLARRGMARRGMAGESRLVEACRVKARKGRQG